MILDPDAHIHDTCIYDPCGMQICMMRTYLWSLILDPDAYIYVGGVPWALFLVINADEKIKRICDKKENDDIATMSVVKLI